MFLRWGRGREDKSGKASWRKENKLAFDTGNIVEKGHSRQVNSVDLTHRKTQDTFEQSAVRNMCRKMDAIQARNFSPVHRM